MAGQKRVFALDVPAIHVLRAAIKDVDAQDKPGHDESFLLSYLYIPTL
jgi:hypothetical protein